MFVITTEGQFSTLYNVAGPSGLIQATDGNFYGTVFDITAGDSSARSATSRGLTAPGPRR